MKNNCLVVTLGYYGRGNTVKEAAENCRKAGSPLTLSACVIIANCEVQFVDPMSVSYNKANEDGLFTVDFKVKKLSALL